MTVLFVTCAFYVSL